MKNFFQFVGVVAVIGFVLMVIVIGSTFSSIIGDSEVKIKTDSILSLNLEGVIMDGKKFLKDLRKYREDPNIKGVLVLINSPGGVVGPSQEIYAELKKTRDVYKKPVVVSGSGLVASGAFYSAMAADKIVTNPGTLMGSIGVIMEFANLEKLYEWAKVKRYVIKTGDFKDTGAEYRAMRDDERQLLESTMQDVLFQFKKAISEGRNMPIEKVSQYADGRIFTGERAVALGFADQIGTYSDAVSMLGELTGLGDHPKIFEPYKDRDSLLQYIIQGQEDTKSSLRELGILENQIRLLGKPLFLMKGNYLE